MRGRRSYRTSLIGVLAAASLLASACAGTTDDGDGSAEPDHQPQLLASGVHVDADGEATGLLFGHTADENWTFELIGPEQMESRRQTQMGGNGGNGGNGGGGGDGGDGDDAFVSPAFPGSQFVVGSGARAQFGDAADSGAHARFAAASNGRSRFGAGSGASTRFEPSASDGAGRCDPTSWCDYTDAVCENYPSYAEGQFSCGESTNDYCRRSLRAADLGTASPRAICAFSALFRCAARGVRSYGRIATDRGLRRAVRRGLQSCRVDLDTDFRLDFFFDSGDGDEGSNE